MANNNLTYLEKLENAHRLRNLRPFSKKSYEWYAEKTRYLGGSKAREIIRDEASKGDWYDGRWEVGSMYMFGYHAKYHNTKKLPYYDRFPLAIIIGRRDNGFLSLSMHYLPPKLRAILFDEIIKISGNKNITERSRLGATYELLKSVSENRYYKPCVKHHIYKQVRTKFIRIPPSQWEAALFLPTEQWYGAVKSKVYKDSIERARR